MNQVGHSHELREVKGHENERVKKDQSSSKTQLNHDCDIHSENLDKSSTKLPRLHKNKTDEKVQEKVVELTPPPLLQRKITDQSDRRSINQSQNTYVIKRVNNKRKTDKKKPIQQSIKPELVVKYDQYVKFLSYVNLSNNFKVNNSSFQNPYRLYVGKGNNGTLIRNLFRIHRPWWVVQQNSETADINLQWFQLRQNSILDDFKSLKKNQADFDKADYFLEEAEVQEKQEQTMVNSVSRPGSRATTNARSQSLVGKQISSSSSASSFFSRKLENPLSKRASSKPKNISNQKQSRVSPSTKKINLRELKDEGLETDGGATSTNLKKNLANPKMWPIYYNYRKIFSASDMKKLKKMNIIKEDGKIHGKIGRYGVREIQNKSLNFSSHNHLQNNWNLSNKKALFMCMKNYYDLKGINPFQYIPMTFHVEKAGDKEHLAFVEEYNRRTEQISVDQKSSKKLQYKTTIFRPKKRNAWLVKPGQNTNRGIGIEVVQNMDEIGKLLEEEQVDKMGRPRTHIIQEYIMPFLYHKRKFDIRCYVLITSVNGCQKGYWYQDGYIRTACKEFNMKNLTNKMIHLTNDAVQKKSEDYGKYEPGNKLSFADFQRYLDANANATETGTKLKFWQQAYPEMKKISTDAIKAVYNKINPHRKDFSFQIFGLDFLIDQNFKVWLIEANTNPCLELSSPLLGRVIPSMLQNALKIAVDPVFPPPSLQDIIKMSKKILLPENPVQTNKFQLVFDEYEEGVQLVALMTNAPEIKIYNIEEEEEEEYDEEGNTYVK